MKVLFDISTLNPQKITGVGVYMLQLMKHIESISDIELQPVLKLSRFKKKQQLEGFLSKSVRTLVPWLPLEPQTTIYHGPDFKLDVRGRFPRIVTVHDLVVFEKKYSDPRFDDKGIKELSAVLNSELAAVIANSEFTKSQIVRYFPHLSEKVHVTLLGCDQDRPHSPLPENLVPKKYILFLGTLEHRKNVRGLIKAFEILRERGHQEHLVLAGAWGFGAEDIQQRMQDSSAADFIHHLNYVREEHVTSLYSQASVLIFPSFYEGFGIPILEAMRAGCPVVTSNRGAMKEVAGDAAEFCDPEDPESIAKAASAVLANYEHASILKQRGQERARKFTWERCAQSTVNVYKKVGKR